MCSMPVMGRDMRGVRIMFVAVMRVAVMGCAGVCSGREPCQCQSQTGERDRGLGHVLPLDATVRSKWTAKINSLDCQSARMAPDG